MTIGWKEQRAHRKRVTTTGWVKIKEITMPAYPYWCDQVFTDLMVTKCTSDVKSSRCTLHHRGCACSAKAEDKNKKAFYIQCTALIFTVSTIHTKAEHHTRLTERLLGNSHRCVFVFWIHINKLPVFSNSERSLNCAWFRCTAVLCRKKAGPLRPTHLHAERETGSLRGQEESI